LPNAEGLATLRSVNLTEKPSKSVGELFIVDNSECEVGFLGRRNPAVEKPSWPRDTVWLDKAQTVALKGVPEAAWNSHIGGHQVCKKWLTDRTGLTLTKDDLTHYQKVVVALAETIRVMKAIDAVIEKHGGWPIK
jgi:hypothetical protein